MRPQRRRVGTRARGRHHVGDQPLVAALVLARDHRRLRHRRMPRQRRLDLARLDAEAAELHLRVRAPEEVEHPVGTPARQIAGPVHPAPGRTIRVGHEPLRRQPGATQIAARQPRTRNVELARDARPEPAAGPRPAHRPGSWADGRPIGICGADCSPSTANAMASMVASVGPYRLVMRATFRCRAISCCELGREGLAAQRQMIQRQRGRRMADDRVQIGRHATHESRRRPGSPARQELRGRVPHRIADDHRRAAADERQHRLLDRGVEGATKSAAPSGSPAPP